MTLTNAKTYIARVIGGAGDSNILALAADAILVKAEEWSRKNKWEWLRKDNSQTRTITGTVTGGTTVTVTSTAGLNVGQVITLTDSAAAVHNHTVASITSTTVFEQSASSANGACSIVLAAYIPVIAGTDTYYLPHDYNDLYGARLLTSKRDLKVVRLREVNRTILDQSSQSYTDAIIPGIGGSGSGWTAADPRDKCRLVGIPDTTEFLHLDYYRSIDGTASVIDVHEDVLYLFLDDCKSWLVRQKNAQDPRADILEGLVQRGIREAIASDKSLDDEDIRMKSQFEVFRPFSYTPHMPYEL